MVIRSPNLLKAMNRQQFTDFIHQPDSIGPASLKLLEELVHRYPYCQTAQLLYTCNLRKEEDLQYPLQLKKAAAYAGDRRKLKLLVELSHLKQVSPPITTSANPEEESTERLPVTTLPSEIITPKEIEHRVLPEAEPATEPAPPLILQPLPVPKNEKISPEALVRMIKTRLAVLDQEKHAALPQDPVFTNTEKKPPLQSKEALIDKFILEEPRISKPKADFFSPDDSAQRSNIDEEEIVSETLAQLYAKQGNTTKAIQIYKKLSLLNQEKSRYFAAQIEKLKL